VLEYTLIHTCILMSIGYKTCIYIIYTCYVQTNLKECARAVSKQAFLLLWVLEYSLIHTHIHALMYIYMHVYTCIYMIFTCNLATHIKKYTDMIWKHDLKMASYCCERWVKLIHTHWCMYVYVYTQGTCTYRMCVCNWCVYVTYQPI